jgi:hypothetical protein
MNSGKSVDWTGGEALRAGTTSTGESGGDGELNLANDDGAAVGRFPL